MAIRGDGLAPARGTPTLPCSADAPRARLERHVPLGARLARRRTACILLAFLVTNPTAAHA
eukprot:293886-Prymnesium_polylepis.1